MSDNYSKADDTEDDVESIPDDLLDDDNDFSEELLISKALLSKNCSIPENILDFQHSFGYDCKRIYNLCLIEKDVLVFASGNLIHFFRISTKKITTRRCRCGGGIGCITKNPNPDYNYLTIGENGLYPPIIIYKYPEMEVISILRKGTERSYSHIDYSPDGELLVAQGGEPDYMITIWNWKKNLVILRSKSFQNDVSNVMFSPFVPGQLTSCGLAHIKFWKMCETFTGLKLKGELGRFGKTEICDMLGIYPMPDEKVLSGCEWGNILVWESGLIKFEVCRKNRQKMHKKAIIQIEMVDGEVMTASFDGYVRIWFWETVELADPPDDDRFVEIEPIYEFKIGNKNHLCEIMWMVKKELDSTDYKWYVQDGNGGIWLADISPDHRPQPPIQLFRCHAGKIVGVEASPISNHVATFGNDGRIHIYNYLTKTLLYFKQFPARGIDMIWIPLTIDPTGVVIVLAFDDGVIRMITVDLTEDEYIEEPVQLIQTIKSHSKSITKLTINKDETILVSGSEDRTIFIHQLFQEIPFVRLIPIGLLEIPSPCTAFNWMPNVTSTILVGCLYGEVVMADLPERPRSYTNISYNLTHIETKILKFKSTKSEIRRDLKIKEIEERKEKKKLRKMESLNRLRVENPGIEIDEETFLVDSESSETLDALYVPPVPNRILWLQYTSRDTIWLSMSGYDAGYIYEFRFDNEDPIMCTLIPEGDDIEIHSIYYFENYLIFGMNNGVIRLNVIKEEYRDLSDYWMLSMHDNFNGTIPKLAFSYDKKYMFSVGYDGNIFSYKWNLPLKDIIIDEPMDAEELYNKVEDIEDPKFLSLEEQKQKDDYDKRMKIANERKEKVLCILSDYKVEFRDILQQNQNLIKSQQITQTELELDARITKDLLQSLDHQMKLIQRKLGFDVEKSKLAGQKTKEYFIEPLESYPIEVIGIVSEKRVRTFRIRKLTDEFNFCTADLDERIRKELENRRIITMIDDTKSSYEEMKLYKVESFLQGLSASTIQTKLETKIKRVLDKYTERKEKEESNKKEWEYINSIKPDPNVNHPDDVKSLMEAENSIGDYKLKTDPIYIPSDEERDTTFKKYKELLQVRKEIYDLRHNYNQKVFKLRDKKQILVDYVANQIIQLTLIHEELSVEQRIHPEYIPKMNEEIEFPETILKVEIASSTGLDVHTILDRCDTEIKPITITEEAFTFDKLNYLQKEVIGLRNVTHETRMDLLIDCTIENVDINKLQPSSNDTYITPWEIEQRYLRLTTKLFEQKQIIEDINKKIEQFDEELEELNEARLKVEVDAKFLDIYLLTINQELWILKDFERLENNLVEKVNNKLIERNEIQTDVIKNRNSIEQNRRNIENMMEQEKVIHNQFMSTCMDNKFSDFLRRIFKRKYKLPKVYNPDESESSESSSESSSSDEGDNVSIDSTEIGPIRMDENVCPPGCDRTLYDLTFSLRSQRHVIEQNIKEEQKSIENTKKIISNLTKEIKRVEIELKSNKGELDAFMREKQKMLNQVETLVILKMDRLQYFRNEEELYDVGTALLFNNSNVSKLYARVGQLALDTLEAKRKHRVNVIHLARMKTDCKFMDNQIIELKEEIQETMIKKFGIKVDLDVLQKSILQRMIYDMRANVDDIKSSMDKAIAIEKKKITKLQEEYNRHIQEGTEKLNILTVLQEEKNYLQEVLAYQEKLASKVNIPHMDFGRDVTKLKEISSQQKAQINILQREIRTLSLKSKPFDPIVNQKFHLPPVSDSSPGFGDKGFDESVFSSALGSVRISSHASSPRDLDALNDIVKMVHRFLLKHTGETMPEKDLNKRGYTISRYLANVAANFDPENTEEILPCVIENFRNFVPQEYQSQFSTKDIALLFTDIVMLYQEIEDDTDPKEVLAAIIDNVLEVYSAQTAMNYTQDVLTEILRQIVTALPVSQIINSERVEQLKNELIKIKEIDAKCINKSKMASNICSFASTNFIDDINMSIIIPFIETIISALLSNQEKD